MPKKISKSPSQLTGHLELYTLIGPPYKREVVRPRHQIPQAKPFAKAATCLQIVISLLISPGGRYFAVDIFKCIFI